MTITLSLVEKAGLVQIRFTLQLRDQRSIYVDGRWMWSLHGFLHGIKWVMLDGHLDYFQKPPLGGRPNTKHGDHGTPNAHNRWFIVFYHMRGPTWIGSHWNSMWLRARLLMTLHYTWGFVTTLHDFGGVLGWPLITFLLGSHNFVVTALGSCVKWLLVLERTKLSQSKTFFLNKRIREK